MQAVLTTHSNDASILFLYAEPGAPPHPVLNIQPDGLLRTYGAVSVEGVAQMEVRPDGVLEIRDARTRSTKPLLGGGVVVERGEPIAFATFCNPDPVLPPETIGFRTVDSVWNFNEDNIYYDYGHVGIGTDDPRAPFQVTVADASINRRREVLRVDVDGVHVGDHLLPLPDSNHRHPDLGSSNLRFRHAYVQSNLDVGRDVIVGRHLQVAGHVAFSTEGDALTYDADRNFYTVTLPALSPAPPLQRLATMTPCNQVPDRSVAFWNASIQAWDFHPSVEVRSNGLYVTDTVHVTDTVEAKHIVGSNIEVLSNVLFGTSNTLIGVQGTAQWASNVAIGTSNVLVGVQGAARWASNVAIGTSNTLIGVQGTAWWASNVAIGTSNTLIGVQGTAWWASNVAIGTSNTLIGVQGTARWASNVAIGTSNTLIGVQGTARWASNVAIGTSNVLIGVQGTARWASNVAIGTSNTLVEVKRTADFASNLAVTTRNSWGVEDGRVYVVNSNVGIGTNLPQTLLHVHSTSTSNELLVELSRSTNLVGEGVNMEFSFLNTLNARVPYAALGSVIKSSTVNAHAGDLVFKTAQGAQGATLQERMRITHLGRMGLGTTTVGAELSLSRTAGTKKLALYDESILENNNVLTDTNFYGLGVDRADGLDQPYNGLRLQVPRTNNRFKFYTSTSLVAQIGSGAGVLTFTGQHRSYPARALLLHLQADPTHLVGRIVVATGAHVSVNTSEPVTGKDAIGITEAVPEVDLARTERHPAVLGVVADREEGDQRRDAYGAFISLSELKAGDQRLFVNSLGEGAIWVCDANGPLRNGDFIASSAVAGYGTRQAEAGMFNYTVAKITMDCDFEAKMVPKRRVAKKTVAVRREVECMEEKVWEEEVEEEERFDAAKGAFVVDRVRVTRRASVPVYDSYPVLDAAGNTLRTKQVPRKRWEETTETVYDLDPDTGALRFEDAPDEYELVYDMRYLTKNGAAIPREEYETRKALGEPVYRAAFVGCTYHCG